MCDQIPKAFQCSITLYRMKDPVVMRDGHSYERDAIKKWIACNPHSPFNPKLTLEMKDAVVNFALKAAIDDWLAKFTFTVAVKSKCGRTIPVTLKLTDKVIDLKRKVSALTGEPVKGMDFVYGTVPISDDAQTIEEYDFQTGAVIHEPFQVMCKSVNGRTFIINDVKLDDSVDSLMEKVCNKTGTDISNVYLTCEGHSMERGKTLEHYGVQKGSLILELFRLKGGTTAPE
jgi:hypothetical protein